VKRRAGAGEYAPFSPDCIPPHLAASGPRGSISPGAFGTRRGGWSRRRAGCSGAWPSALLPMSLGRRELCSRPRPDHEGVVAVFGDLEKSRDVRKWPISTESLCYPLSAAGET
jgi:hypothetical protein